jgi:hypothetical protein
MDEPADLATATPLSLFMARVRGQWERLKAGADPLDVDVSVVAELRKLLAVAGMRLPSDAFIWALSDTLDGKAAPYLSRRRPHRAVSTRRQRLMGLVAHWIEMAIAGSFSAGDAADLVALQLDIAGFRRSGGRPYAAATLTNWHEFVMHRARSGTDVARDMFEMQKAVFEQTHPDHRQWNTDELRAWLGKSVRRTAFVFHGKG